jgi:hypothetical protein
VTGATNHQLTPIGVSLTQIAMRKAQDGQQLQGKMLPCHVTVVKGAIVTIAFDVKSQYTLPTMDVPVASDQYVRGSVQVNDKGYAVAGDAFIGNNSGLGENASNLAPRANLSNLVFHPIGNTKWDNVDTNQNTHTAPNGSLHQTTDKKQSFNLNANTIGSIVMKAVKKVFNINQVSDGNIAMYADPGSLTDFIYIGGDGKTGTYDFASTPSGPSKNVKIRIG